MSERGHNQAPVSGTIDTNDTAAKDRATALQVVRAHCHAAWAEGAREGEAVSDVRVGLTALALWARDGRDDDLDAARRAFSHACEADSRFGLARIAVHMLCSWARLAARKGAP